MWRMGNVPVLSFPEGSIGTLLLGAKLFINAVMARKLKKRLLYSNDVSVDSEQAKVLQQMQSKVLCVVLYIFHFDALKNLSRVFFEQFSLQKSEFLTFKTKCYKICYTTTISSLFGVIDEFVFSTLKLKKFGEPSGFCRVSFYSRFHFYRFYSCDNSGKL